MKIKSLIHLISLLYLVVSGCSIKHSDDAINVITEDITIGSQATATYEINNYIFGKGYKLHTTTGKNTILERYKYDSDNERSGFNVFYKEINGLEVYFINPENIKDITINHGFQVIWGEDTNINDIFSTMKEINPDIQKYCELEINHHQDGSISAGIVFGSDPEDIKLFFEIAQICNGSIFCKTNSNKSECEYGASKKNGGGWSNIVTASLKRLK